MELGGLDDRVPVKLYIKEAAISIGLSIQKRRLSATPHQNSGTTIDSKFWEIFSNLDGKMTKNIVSDIEVIAVGLCINQGIELLCLTHPHRCHIDIEIEVHW